MRHNKYDCITNKLALKPAITLRKYPLSVFLLLLLPSSSSSFSSHHISAHLMSFARVTLTFRKEVQTNGCFLLMGAVQNT